MTLMVLMYWIYKLTVFNWFNHNLQTYFHNNNSNSINNINNINNNNNNNNKNNNDNNIKNW